MGCTSMCVGNRRACAAEEEDRRSGKQERAGHLTDGVACLRATGMHPRLRVDGFLAVAGETQAA